MKLCKNIKSVIIIFCVIQMISSIFIPLGVNAGFLQDIVETSKEFQERSSGNVHVENIMNVISEPYNEIYWVVMLVFVVIFLGAVGYTIITSKTNNPADKAKAKQKIIIYIIIALLAVFGIKLIELAMDFFTIK